MSGLSQWKDWIGCSIAWFGTTDTRICYFCISGFCAKDNQKILEYNHVEVVIKSIVNAVCPSGKQCPDDNTCCKSTSDTYQCCPVAEIKRI